MASRNTFPNVPTFGLPTARPANPADRLAALAAAMTGGPREARRTEDKEPPGNDPVPAADTAAQPATPRNDADTP